MFAGWKIWLLQAALFTAVGGLISRIYGDSYGISRDKIPFLLCCSAVLIAMTVLPFLQRLYLQGEGTVSGSVF